MMHEQQTVIQASRQVPYTAILGAGLRVNTHAQKHNKQGIGPPVLCTAYLCFCGIPDEMLGPVRSARCDNSSILRNKLLSSSHEIYQVLLPTEYKCHSVQPSTHDASGLCTIYLLALDLWHSE